MPKSCWCKVPGCEGLHVQYRKRRTDRTRKLRQQAKQSLPTPNSPRLLSSAPNIFMPDTVVRPVLPPQSLPPFPQFPDLSQYPPPSSSSPVEQEMLDHGSLSVSDLYLDTSLPSLPPGMHNGDMLMACVDYGSSYLDAMSARDQPPLIPPIAHSIPSLSLEEKRFFRQYEEAIAEAQEEQQDEDLSFPASDDNSFLPPLPDLSQVADEADADDDEDDEGDSVEPDGSDDLASTMPLYQASSFLTDVDNPDPFLRRHPSYHSPDLDAIDSHLVCIYSLVAWLHLHFHLSRVACNAILWAFALVISLVAPAAAMPFVTLKSANRTLGLDTLPVTVLPVCPGCKEVYPASNSTPDCCTKCKSPLFKDALTQRGTKRSSPVPLIKYPTMSIASQLEAMLSVPGVEAALDGWRKKTRQAGVFGDIFDGAVTQNLLDPDGKVFFVNDGPQHANGPGGELRLGLAWGVDWFSYLRSNIAPSHSSCPTSFSIVNLPPALRYRVANLLLTGIIPGPTEQTGDELQRFMRPFINELIRLWKDGIVIRTPASPQGRLVRVILVAVVCDKPAAHKIGGFGSHSHTMFCTRCWISTTFKSTPKAFETGAFPPRTNAEHRRQGEEYSRLKNESARKAYSKAHAVRFTALSRLPYFDLVRQIVVDPMHNLYLGLVKTHFYHIWVQMKILREKHELRVLHELLQNFSLPSSAGKLPKDIGIPAGGSLTADQWKLLAIFHGPIIIPQLWRRCMPQDAEACRMNRLRRIAEDEAKKATAKKEKAAQTVKKRAQKKVQQTSTPVTDHVPVQTTHDISSAAPELLQPNTASSHSAPEVPSVQSVPPSPDPQCNLHPDDPANFLKLSEALRILARYVLTESDIQEADRLLREYCTELIKLYGNSCIRPNHHYATHTAEFVRDFGPLHDFWSFLFERLNKVLKAYNTNNHGGGGELETTFFTEFHRTSASSRLTYMMQCADEKSVVHRLSTVMLNATNEERGTVATLAVLVDDMDAVGQEEGQAVENYEMSARQKTGAMSSELYATLLNHFWRQYPHWHLHSKYARPLHVDSLPMTETAINFDYVALHGQRFYSGNMSGKASIMEANVPWSHMPACGRILDIFQFQQSHSLPPMWLARVRWFKPWEGSHEPVWDSSKRLNVRLWYLEEYLSRDEADDIIEVTQFRGLLALQVVTVGSADAKVWATIPYGHTR